MLNEMLVNCNFIMQLVLHRNKFLWAAMGTHIERAPLKMKIYACKRHLFRSKKCLINNSINISNTVLQNSLLLINQDYSKEISKKLLLFWTVLDVIVIYTWIVPFFGRNTETQLTSTRSNRNWFGKGKDIVSVYVERKRKYILYWLGTRLVLALHEKAGNILIFRRGLKWKCLYEGWELK